VLDEAISLGEMRKAVEIQTIGIPILLAVIRKQTLNPLEFSVQLDRNFISRTYLERFLQFLARVRMSSGKTGIGGGEAPSVLPAA